jgi:hypothetical protein
VLVVGSQPGAFQELAVLTLYAAGGLQIREFRSFRTYLILFTVTGVGKRAEDALAEDACTS